MRSLTPVEAAFAIAIGGSVLATTVPAFVKNVHASRLAEPLDGLNRIAARATVLAAGRTLESAYPESVGLTPAEVPRGRRVTDPEGTWSHPTWLRLNFSIEGPHSYSFVFDSQNAAASDEEARERGLRRDRATFVARAHGDLDGDGSLSTFEISGETREGAEPRILPMVVRREVE